MKGNASKLSRIKKSKARESVLTKQLQRIGKVGGVVDSRLGARDKNRSEAEKSLQRHIVEKLRQLNGVNFEHDDTDPLTRAAFGQHSGKTGKEFELDEHADSGIPGDVVEEEFFTSRSNSTGFKETLSEKIASSKLDKLKRVEENEEQRNRIKEADMEWSQKLRFSLSQLSSIKPKARVSEKSTANRKSVSELLGQLVDDRRLPPCNSKLSTKSTEDHLLNLQSIILNRSGSTAIETTNSNVIPNEDSEPGKKLDQLLRIMFRMPEHENHVSTFVAEQLVQAEFSNLTDVIRYLLFAQILIEHCHAKASTLNTKYSTVSSNTSGSFFPELVTFLTNLWQLAGENSTSSSSNILVADSLESEVSDPPPLSLSLARQSLASAITSNDLPLIRLSTLDRLLSLSIQTVELYRRLLPSCVCALLFQRMHRYVVSVDTRAYSTSMRTRITKLSNMINECLRAPTPKHLLSTMRLTVLSSDQQSLETVRTLKKFGLLPQLEPKFDDRFAVHRDKKVAARRLLQRKFSHEKRGAMREIRRDGQFLATHQLQQTKASDQMRKQKTQAILNSLRSIND